MLLLLALVVVKASHFVIQNAFCQMFDEWGSLTSICIFKLIHSCFDRIIKKNFLPHFGHNKMVIFMKVKGSIALLSHNAKVLALLESEVRNQ